MRNHGGLAEILRTKQFPGFRMRWPNEGRYVSGLARFPGDPNAHCSTRDEVHEKVRKQGKEIIADLT